MTIKFKKRIMVFGTALFMGATAFTSYAADQYLFVVR